jgi:hypothetical protein
VREYALRHWLEALADDALHPHFNTLGDDEHARFVRLLSSARRLIHEVLPRVRRVLRCETTDTRRTMREPAGGRVDPVASLRLAMTARGRSDPDDWVVTRRERLVDTPVNRFVVAILRKVERWIGGALRRDDGRWRAMAGERGLLVRARQALRDFFAMTPLGQLEAPRDSLHALRAAARLRRSEYERIAALDEWWHHFERAWLEALHANDAAEPMHVELGYELCAALGLVLALRGRFALAEAAPGRFAFRGAREAVEVRFGDAAGRHWGRPPTAALTVRREGEAAREVLVEARNLGAVAAAELAQRMEFWLALTPDARALLLTPATPPTPPDGSRLAWASFLPELAVASACDTSAAWKPLLDHLTS